MINWQKNGSFPVSYTHLIQGHPYTSEAYYHEPEKFGADSLAAEYVRTTRCPVADIRQFIQKHKKEIEGVNFIVYDPELKKRCV